jgi:hypothetical protein
MATLRRPGTGYTNIGDILKLNQGAAQQMSSNLAGRVAQGAEGAAKPVNQSVDTFRPSRETEGATSWEGANKANLVGWQSGLDDAQARVNALGSAAGRGALMNDYYGRGTTGGRRMDSILSGMTNDPKMKETQWRYQNIRSLLGDARTAANVSQQGFDTKTAAEDEAEKKRQEEAAKQNDPANPNAGLEERKPGGRGKRWDDTYSP